MHTDFFCHGLHELFQQAVIVKTNFKQALSRHFFKKPNSSSLFANAVWYKISFASSRRSDASFQADPAMKFASTYGMIKQHKYLYQGASVVPSACITDPGKGLFKYVLPFENKQRYNLYEPALHCCYIRSVVCKKNVRAGIVTEQKLVYFSITLFFIPFAATFFLTP